METKRNYIYARCSTNGGQSTGAQILEMDEYFKTTDLGINSSNTQVVEEYISGDVPPSERKLMQLIESCNEGDVIYIAKYTRWARNSSWGMYMFETCWKKGVRIFNCDQRRFIEPDPNAPMSKLIIFVELSQGETNLHDIRKGQKAGIKKAKKEGVLYGRSNPKYKVDPVARERAKSKSALTKVINRLNNPQLKLIIKSIETVLPKIKDYALEASKYPFLGYNNHRKIVSYEWASIQRTYVALCGDNPVADKDLSIDEMKKQYFYLWRGRFAELLKELEIN